MISSSGLALPSGAVILLGSPSSSDSVTSESVLGAAAASIVSPFSPSSALKSGMYQRIVMIWLLSLDNFYQLTRSAHKVIVSPGCGRG